MKITKRQLRRIIKEEKRKLLKEMWGNAESQSPLIQFSQAWASLGGAVQEQMITIVNAYIENNPEDAYDVNPAALKEARYRLGNSLNVLGQSNPDAAELLEAMEWAQDIFDEGDAEVESDRAAAENQKQPPDELMQRDGY